MSATKPIPKRPAVRVANRRPVVALRVAVAALLLAPFSPLLATGGVAPNPGGSTVVTNSTTSTYVDRSITEPGVALVGGSGPEGAALGRILAGPNGAQVSTALGAIGVSTGGLTLISTTNTTVPTGIQTVTLATTFGPGVILVGDNQQDTFYVQAGQTDININTNTQYWTDLIYQHTSSLTARQASWLSGDLYTTVQTTALDEGFRFVDGLLARERGGASASVPQAKAVTSDGWSVWLTGSGDKAGVSGNADNYGFNYSTGGVSGGAERSYGSWFFGGAAAYGSGGITQQTTSDHVALDTVRLGLYGAWRPGPLSVSGVVSWGQDQVQANRIAPLPEYGSYRTNSLNAGLEIAYALPAEQITLQPMVGAVYDSLWSPGFIESNGPLGLAVDSSHVATLRLYAGGRAWHNFTTSTGWVLTPEVSARVVYDTLNDPRAFDASFLNDPIPSTFTVTGIQPPRLGGLLGAGLAVRGQGHVSGFVNYDAEVRGGDLAQSIRGGLKLSF